MYIIKEHFFNNVRKHFGKLDQNMVNGIDLLIDKWNNEYSDYPIEYFACVLGEVYHETGRTFLPVREGFCDTDECSIRKITNMYRKGKISSNYSLPYSNGKSYFGRGWLQITWWYNYLKLQEKYGFPIFDNPDLLLTVEVNAELTIITMINGDYTGAKLSDYFTQYKKDWYNSRRIINGTDKATLISGYKKKFYNALTGANVRVSLTEWLSMQKAKHIPNSNYKEFQTYFKKANPATVSQ